MEVITVSKSRLKELYETKGPKIACEELHLFPTQLYRLLRKLDIPVKNPRPKTRKIILEE